MTEALIEHFREKLESLEKARLKIIHDRKAFLFILLLAWFLAFCCLIAGAFGPSRVVLMFSFALMIGCETLRRIRGRLFTSFQLKFRAEITRDWFHVAYPGAFLAPAPSTSQIPIEVSRSLREACVRATAQTPSLTSIEERIFFDNDSYHSWTFILAERSRWSRRIRSRAIVWFRAASDETGLVAFAWPPRGLSKAPDVRFFMNGRPMETSEPLRSKLVGVYDRLRAKSSGQAVRVSLSPTGVWAGVKLKGALFEAPVFTSLLETESYASWSEQAQLPADREIVSLLFSI